MADPPSMDLHDEWCICFHVPGHKIAKFIRLTQPKVPSQCSECYGAGTGCGWCIPYIEKLFGQVKAGAVEPRIAMDREEYLARRRNHLLKKTPPTDTDDQTKPNLDHSDD